MRMDAQKDPSIDPDVARARLIVDQVLFFFIRIHIIYYI
jgi:hypothetical protein